MTVQAHVFYSGMVQGVGFRYTVRRFAQDGGLCGWVKNLADGRVEVLAEGPRPDIDRLLELVRSHFGDYIEGVDVTYGESREPFSQFTIAV